VSVRAAPRDIDTIARMTITSRAAAMIAAAVGLSPKMRVESDVVVRGDAAALSSCRSVRALTVTSRDDEPDDDVPGVVACDELLLELDGVEADGVDVVSDDDDDELELDGCCVVGALLGCCVDV
jgi:hypothetical protein